MSKHMQFELLCAEGRKTQLWLVRSMGGDVLGRISWWPHWKKYTFQPVQGTIYDASCMRELAMFCARQTVEHKKELLAKRGLTV